MTEQCATFKAATFLKKRNTLNDAIRAQGTPDIQDAWDDFYGYTDCVPLCADTVPQSEVDAVRAENMELLGKLEGARDEALAEAADFDFLRSFYAEQSGGVWVDEVMDADARALGAAIRALRTRKD